MSYDRENENNFDYEKVSEKEGPLHGDSNSGTAPDIADTGAQQPSSGVFSDGVSYSVSPPADNSPQTPPPAPETIYVPPAGYNYNQSQSGQQEEPRTYYAGDYAYGAWQAPQPPSPPRKVKPPRKKRSSAFAAVLVVIGMLCVGLIAGSVAYVIGYNSAGGSGGLKINSTPETSQAVGTSSNSASGGGQKVDLKPSDGSVLTIPQIYKKLSPSVVSILVDNGSGSGVIMSSDGYIITNDHVVSGSKNISVRFTDGSEAEAKLVGTDSLTDIAVIKVSRTDLTAAPFGDSSKLEVGEAVVAIGNPYGLDLANTITSGIVSGIRTNIMITDKVMTLIQHTASINMGNSGGPLINSYGQVVGINSAKIIGISSEAEGLGFAIPTAVLKPVVDDLIQYGVVKNRPMLGISGIMLSKQDAEFLNFPVGLYVQSVNPNSDAYKQGLRVRDIITKINGKSFSSFAEFNAEKEKFKIGDSVKLTVWRNGQTFDLTVKLIENTPD